MFSLLQLMIIVDDAGGFLPALNHSPWDGVTIADFVMPFFLFIVGVSLTLAYKVYWTLRSQTHYSLYSLFLQIKCRVISMLNDDLSYHYVQRVPDKLEATKKALLRALKLFCLGLVLQGILDLTTSIKTCAIKKFPQKS